MHKSVGIVVSINQSKSKNISKMHLSFKKIKIKKRFNIIVEWKLKHCCMRIPFAPTKQQPKIT